MKTLHPAVAVALGVSLLVGLGACSRATWKQIGSDTRKAVETTGEAIEGAAKGVAEALKGD